jgi:hypothetical protein
LESSFYRNERAAISNCVVQASTCCAFFPSRANFGWFLTALGQFNFNFSSNLDMFGAFRGHLKRSLHGSCS